jgi:hypothetical protein
MAGQISLEIDWAQVFVGYHTPPTGESFIERWPIYRARTAYLVHVVKEHANRSAHREGPGPASISQRGIALAQWRKIAERVNNALPMLPPLDVAHYMAIYAVNLLVRYVFL